LKARLLWELDQEKTTHLPQFVDQALKMLSLKRVAFEIENSMMSKVSCTACKAGEEIPNDANEKKINFLASLTLNDMFTHFEQLRYLDFYTLIKFLNLISLEKREIIFEDYTEKKLSSKKLTTIRKA
jgi:hypothetical protein